MSYSDLFLSRKRARTCNRTQYYVATGQLGVQKQIHPDQYTLFLKNVTLVGKVSELFITPFPDDHFRATTGIDTIMHCSI